MEKSLIGIISSLLFVGIMSHYIPNALATVTEQPPPGQQDCNGGNAALA